MIRKILFLIISGFLLSGCVGGAVALIQTGVGLSQGKVIQSAITPVFSLAIKETTGKTPLEHIITKNKEKQRIAKKSKNLDKKDIKKTNPEKSIKNQMTLLTDKMYKETFSKNSFQHNPRFSYQPK
tara:strand:- start:162 stop:539 length:378 start_codon:yes stop_codon:yes gene_type:complete